MHTTPLTEALVHGAVEFEPTDAGLRVHRLPTWARAQAADPQLAMVEAQPAGARVVVSTTARRVELRALATRFAYRGAPARPDGVFDVVVDGALVAQGTLDDATLVTLDPRTGGAETTPGQVRGVVADNLPEGDKRVEIWLPHQETIELVELLSDAPVRPVDPAGRRWVHHGSSISQGSNAAHPTGTWAAIAAMAGGVDLLNLGFGGSAMVDPFVARTMRDLPADLISLSLGINVVNADAMRRRAFRPAVHGFLDTIREGHPTTPLLVVSPILCPIHESTPGPGAFDVEALGRGELKFIATGDPDEVNAGRLTLRVIRKELARIVEERSADDPNLHYLDGRELYGKADEAQLPLPDNLHPTTAAHRRIGERFARRAFGPGGPFAVSHA
ncbi:GDSL-type esterase/lipase family protein [Xylanimonas ulmi]|uniref:GDSL-like lipase/acylhydrolase family protein n=1 Tax=Xylanimonas ulmi TaxID=228973 RepID=A0A4Q7M5H8_9MICO|nr:GDSL-type esterase/lipase family protein [Xylanibacterium ulmi]RZS62894.1 GDSL-like lipase/acylhydrolase family protein [Xylanibacterium ulmi]